MSTQKQIYIIMDKRKKTMLFACCSIVDLDTQYLSKNFTIKLAKIFN